MSEAPDDTPHPERFDPWAPKHRGRALQFFAVSGVMHAVLLVVLATVTVHIVRKVEEIKVKVIEDTSLDGIEDYDGAPSLKDLAGVLKVAKAEAQQARPSGPHIENIKAPEMPRIGGVGPKIGTGPVIDDAVVTGFGAGGFGGAGGIGGLAGSFGDYVGGLRKTGLDLALVIDTTDNMQFAIDEVKEKLTTFVGAIQHMVPTARVGIVAYRDKGDDYVVKWSDLSFKTDKLREFLSHIKADGGGDYEEAVLDALQGAVEELSWRKSSKKVIVLVAGSPPHAWDVDATRSLARKWHNSGGYISAIDVTERLHHEHDYFMWRALHGKETYKPSPLPDYMQETAKTLESIAKDGGGEKLSLSEDKALIRGVLVLTFGSRWKVEMAKFLPELS